MIFNQIKHWQNILKQIKQNGNVIAAWIVKGSEQEDAEEAVDLFLLEFV